MEYFRITSYIWKSRACKYSPVICRVKEQSEAHTMDKRRPTLLEKTREVLRLKQYAQTTEESYTYWVAFVRIDWWVRSHVCHHEDRPYSA